MPALVDQETRSLRTQFSTRGLTQKQQREKRLIWTNLRWTNGVNRRGQERDESQQEEKPEQPLKGDSLPRQSPMPTRPQSLLDLEEGGGECC